MTFQIDDLLRLMVRDGASDLHVKAGSAPGLRIDGQVQAQTELGPLTPEVTARLARELMSDEQWERFLQEKDIDFSYALPGCARFRVNALHQRNAVGVVIRQIPDEIPDHKTLQLPQVTLDLASKPRGLVLVTGPTGSGKSTTLAAMIDHINQNRQAHIVTIEDPVEFTHVHKSCVVTQREVGGDTRNFQSALRSVLRQDPDVVLVGELRDHETIEAALTLAETGHLTFGTLHTSDAVQTINRIIDVFPSHQQAQVRTMLSFTLEGVFSQKLLPRAGERGRAMAAEIMLATPGIRALIRDGKSHQIYSQVQTGGRLGMRTMAQSLANLVAEGKVRLADAERALSDPSELQNCLRAA